MEQWGSLYIEGEYRERKDDKTGVVTPAKCKNTLQNKIKGAVNFIGSPIHTLLVAGGVALDLPNVGEDPDERGNGQAAATPAKTQGSQTSSTTSPSNDALGGII
jgi:hypothetical protein